MKRKKLVRDLIPTDVLVKHGWIESEAAFFGGFEEEYYIRDLHLSTATSKQLFKRTFETVSRDVFCLTFPQFSQADPVMADKSRIDIVEALNRAQALIANAGKALEQETRAGRELLRKAGIDASGVGHFKQIMPAAKVFAPITSQAAEEFVELMLLADDCAAMNNFVHANHLIKQKNKVQNTEFIMATVSEAVKGIKDIAAAFVLTPFAMAMKRAGYEEYPGSEGGSPKRRVCTVCPIRSGNYATRYQKESVVVWGCPHCQSIKEQ